MLPHQTGLRRGVIQSRCHRHIRRNGQKLAASAGEFCEVFFDQSVWRCGQGYRYGNASDPEQLTL